MLDLFFYPFSLNYIYESLGTLFSYTCASGNILAGHLLELEGCTVDLGDIMAVSLFTDGKIDYCVVDSITWHEVNKSQKTSTFYSEICII